MQKTLLAIILAALAFSATASETLYVTDKLWVQLRTGPSTEYRIIRNLVSGEAVEVLEASELPDDKYTKVRARNSIEGYVLSQYLQKDPAAKNQLTIANNEVTQLKNELSKLRQSYNELKTNANKLSSEGSDLAKSNEELEQELAHIKSISASALELDEKYQELIKEKHALEVQVQALSTENTQLHDNRQQTYILYGGGLVFAGILAGLILPSLRGRRNSGWS